MPRSAPFTGGCLCGKVRYEIDSAPMFAVHCFCRDCQKATGAGHATVAGFPEVALQLTGEVTAYSSPGSSGLPVTRHFCPTCGGRIFSRGQRSEGVIFLQAGSLDEPDRIVPAAAVYHRDAISWDHLDAAVTAYEAMPPAP